MKNLFLFLAVVSLFVGCGKVNTLTSTPTIMYPSFQCTETLNNQVNSVYGTWKLVEHDTDAILQSIDKNGNIIAVYLWEEAVNGHLITIEKDGTFNSTEFTKNFPNCTTGTVTMTEKIITLNYNCDNPVLAHYRYNYTFDDKKLQLKLLQLSTRAGVCFAACSTFRFCKQALVK